VLHCGKEEEMEKPILSDINKFPDDEIVFNHLGKRQTLWKELFEHLDANYPDLNRDWKYYNDGKSWLMKVTRKSKTIFWLSVIKGAFRTTFYFTDKSKKQILSSSISEDLKEQFSSKSGLRGITIIFSKKDDIRQAEELIKLKVSSK